jgi:hypothetical protein
MRNSKRSQTTSRLAAWSSGKRAKRRCCQRRYGRSGFGITQFGERWKITSSPASLAISGTNWIELAPVPTTATLFPASSTSWSQRAE